MQRYCVLFQKKKTNDELAFVYEIILGAKQVTDQIPAFVGKDITLRRKQKMTQWGEAILYGIRTITMQESWVGFKHLPAETKNDPNGVRLYFTGFGDSHLAGKDITLRRTVAAYMLSGAKCAETKNDPNGVRLYFTGFEPLRCKHRYEPPLG